MPEREQKRKPAPREEAVEVDEAPARSEQGEKIKAELDDLLDEIDEVLEQTPRTSSSPTSRRAASSLAAVQAPPVLPAR